MKDFVIIWSMVLIICSCSRADFVQISGRVENGDSIVSIWVEDSIFSFPLDENDFFAGKIPLQKAGYATLMYNSLNLYLSPGENLEVCVNTLNFSSSLYFRGSLGGVNNYLKEQDMAAFFDKDDYLLGENDFLIKMQSLIDEKIKLLIAKNFDEAFTTLEKDRIRYSVAARVSYYPHYRLSVLGDDKYWPGKNLTAFLATFPLNNTALLGTQDYRTFLLNYVYWKGNMRETGGNPNKSVDYILATVNNPSVKNFLLTEMVSRYLWENNGVEGAEYLLKAFRRECTDKGKLAYINELASHWDKLRAGCLAPDFTLINDQGEKVSLKDYKGSYLYITVWASWCSPCKSELVYLEPLQKVYRGKNIRFLTVAIDGNSLPQHAHDFLKEYKCPGIHTIADSVGHFNEDYMIVSVPRFILIGPQGEIISSNAPRPSGPVCQLLDSLNM